MLLGPSFLNIINVGWGWRGFSKIWRVPHWPHLVYTVLQQLSRVSDRSPALSRDSRDWTGDGRHANHLLWDWAMGLPRKKQSCIGFCGSCPPPISQALSVPMWFFLLWKRSGSWISKPHHKGGTRANKVRHLWTSINFKGHSTFP